MENWEITSSAGHPESQECSEGAVAQKRSLTDIGAAVVIPARIEQHWRVERPPAFVWIDWELLPRQIRILQRSTE